jgi:negative regulator of flagellin synthesis FlgM
MINVNGVQGAAPPPVVESVGTIQTHIRPAEAAGISDVVEISTVAKLAAKVHEMPDVRTELVERVKAEIAAGTYETPERLEIAIDKLMEELFPNL